MRQTSRKKFNELRESSKHEKLRYNCEKPGHFAAKCPHVKKSSKASKQKGLCSVFGIGDVKTDEWYFDSGATCHMARSDQPYVSAVDMAHDIGTANNSNMKAVAKRTVAMETKHG